MKLITEKYEVQKLRWPETGRHILAQYDADSVVVYQAYKPSIGSFAAENGFFGGSFSLERMSWIKPNFLWMMYRCGWASKFNQETVLAVRISRAGFDTILSQAVHSSFDAERYGTEEKWGEALGRHPVRLQWDPDHTPHGHKEERRAIQLGLKGAVLAKYAREWVVSIEDISEFCREQSAHVQARRMSALLTPREDVYPVSNAEIARRIGVDSWNLAGGTAL